MWPYLSAGFEGFFLGAGLIIAIGAQNAYLLQLGLLRAHVLPATLFCAFSDAFLIALGVAGVGAVIDANRDLLTIIKYLGAAFLLTYAGFAVRRMFRPETLQSRQNSAPQLRTVIAALFAFTFLNPHVYFDTVLLIGSISGRHEADARLWFAAGAMTASFVWFFSLGYGARLLAPFFASPRAWQVLDGLIAMIMTVIALSLVTV